MYSKNKLTLSNTKDDFKKYLYQELKRPSTIDAYMNDFKIFESFMKEELNNKIRYIYKITNVEIQQYKDYLLSKYKLSTCKRKFISLKVYFAFLEKLYHIINIIKNDKWGNSKNNKQLKNDILVLTKEDTTTLLNCIDKSNSKNKYRDKCIINMLVSCGIRSSELRSIKWNDIDFAEKTLKISRKKNCSYDIVKINSRLVGQLSTYYKILGNNKGDFVFKTRQSDRLSKSALNSLIQNYWEKSGLKAQYNVNLTPHSFRHTFITNCIKNNISLEKIIRYTGHSKINTLSVYTHLCSEDTCEVADCMDEFID